MEFIQDPEEKKKMLSNPLFKLEHQVEDLRKAKDAKP
jgi:hypothetical protein